ncbi:MAG: ADP-ribosylglycohydrolase family protein [Thermoguttaceae bacterium]|nr:ADP-ribosylglycohydrolase family protein [Thermoguttaceae bacterium]
MNNKWNLLTLVAATLFATVAFSPRVDAEDVVVDGKTYRKLSVEEYRDKMKGGWIGQIAGVCWGAPTEFRYCGRIIPEAEMPKWTPDMINNAFGQDDLYVEMTFLRSMEEHGLDVSIRQAGIDFANSEYPLWHANVHGRKNLRCGIAPPNSSRPEFSHCADDIDYQIESDFSGLISPGLPNNAVRMGEKFGRLMNYGDGMYAGQFVGALYAEAFFETDVYKIIDAALKAIPAESGYAEMARDVLRWKKEFPDDWEACWNKINEKYQLNPEYRKWSCSGPSSDFNIDVKINGAYILVGLLYGDGDLDKTIVLATRCGQDSDCNPSSAGGVLFTTLGFKALPERFSKELDETRVFSHTAYNFPALLDVCEKLAIQAVEREGGFVKEEDGERFFYIPRTEVVPSALTSCANPTDQPDESATGRFSEEELKQLRFREYNDDEALEKFFGGFKVSHMGPDMNPGFRDEYRGKKNVFMTHPESREVGAVLSKLVTPEKGDVLYLSVANHENADAKQIGDFTLQIKINGGVVMETLVSRDAVGDDGWMWVEVDLSKYAGQPTLVEIVNQPNGWSWEAAYFSTIGIDKPNVCEAP